MVVIWNRVPSLRAHQWLRELEGSICHMGSFTKNFHSSLLDKSTCRKEHDRLSIEAKIPVNRIVLNMYLYVILFFRISISSFRISYTVFWLYSPPSPNYNHMYYLTATKPTSCPLYFFLNSSCPIAHILIDSWPPMRVWLSDIPAAKFFNQIEPLPEVINCQYLLNQAWDLGNISYHHAGILPGLQNIQP